MSFPRYKQYKNSGHDWLGDIPDHWKVAKFRHYFVESSEKIDGDVEGVMLSVSGYRGIEIKQYEDENQRRSEENLLGYRIVRPGQLVVNTMWLNYAGLGVSDFEGHVSPAYRTYWIDEHLEKRFVHHLMRSQQYVLGYTKFLTGVRPNSLQMSRDDLMVFPVLIPPVDEQRSVARFLDQETAKIDALIEEQQRLIDLLKEKRQAVISHVVTKGLHSDVAMTDSGVDWIGEVPRQWFVTRLGYFATVENGTTPSKEKLEYWTDGQIPWLASGEVNQLRIVEANEFITKQALADSSLRLLPEGTVVVGLVGQGKTRGMSAILCMTATINQNLAAICPGPKIDSEYIFYLFQAMYVSLREDGRGGNQAAINCKMLAALQIPVPPIQEQQGIAAFLNILSEETNTLESELNGAIQILRERRSALISAAVTGKIDVRNYTPKEIA